MKINNELSNTLNFLRWVAALLVVLGHLRSFIFVNDYNIEINTIFYKLFYFSTSFGHQAVMVFFVLSGYLVGGSLMNKYNQNILTKDTIINYVISRFSRIYIVLIPAIVFGYAFDYIGHNIYPELYTNAFHIFAMNYNATERLSFWIIIGNMLNLQTIFFNTLGTNGPLWSLSYEWSYYILFLLIFINNKSRSFFLLLMTVLLFLNINLLLYAVIWMIGVFASRFDKQYISKYLSYVIFLMVLIIPRIVTSGYFFYMDFIIGLSVVLIINSLQFTKPTKNKVIIFQNFNHFIAKFSYSTYLFHLPFIVIVISIFHYFNIELINLQPNIYNIIIFLLFMFGIYVYTYLMYLFFESKTQKLKNFIIVKVGKFQKRIIE